MTREELGITPEGEAYIDAIIHRGEVEKRLQYRRLRYYDDDPWVLALKEELKHARAEEERTRDVSRAQYEQIKGEL